MGILIHEALFTLAAVGYFGLMHHFWKTRWAGNAPDAGISMKPWERTSIGLLLIAHGLALFLAVMRQEPVQFSFALAIAGMCWMATSAYWVENFRLKLEAMQPLILGLAGVSCLFPVLFAKTHPLTHASNAAFFLHFLTAMLAYSLFALAALHAIFLNFAERQLHKRHFSRGLKSLPSILSMEDLLFRMITGGFALLTFTLLSGAFFSESIYGKPIHFDHKTIFGWISWLIFAALLMGRWRLGWRGKKAQRWLLTGFIVLVLAYVGSRFVVEAILQR